MKRTLLIATALLLSVGAFAQENRQGFQRPDEATMIKMRTERMAQQLGLDEAQTAKLLELNQKYPNAMMGGPGGPGMGRPSREARDEQNATDENANGKKVKKAKKAKKAEKAEGETNDRESRMKEMQASMEAYETELKGILTEEQFKTWQENRNRRPEGRGPGGPGGQGRPGGRGGFGQGGNFGGGNFGGGEEF
ncbi:MAG: DUF4890 domain-containing protein [Bacteroidales bacterium]|nr:DUF4890 domain-containing protein [Bacteroidales bacterium]